MGGTNNQCNNQLADLGASRADECLARAPQGRIDLLPVIVLAAGTSSRYGCSNKLLADFDGLPLLARVISMLQPAARPLIVVTGHQAQRVRRSMRQALGHVPHLRWVHNPHYRQGMASSLRLGINALPAEASKVCICLGDMPGVDARLLRRLQALWHPELDVVRPSCRSRPGHPVLLSARLFPALQALAGDGGAKSVVARVPAARRRQVPWHVGCILDTDTPAALRHARLQCRRIANRLQPIGCKQGFVPTGCHLLCLGS
ncbi:MAG TPA: nucleotidyltransferase family protein [Salinisphaeraceae bacterium]|nr:nucleotidyltransferase family protein [Salinisphaeraceae bacterium]